MAHLGADNEPRGGNVRGDSALHENRVGRLASIKARNSHLDEVADFCRKVWREPRTNSLPDDELFGRGGVVSTGSKYYFAERFCSGQ